MKKTAENEKKEFFTPKMKGFFAAGALIFAVIWLILWGMFPMEWYSLFFAESAVIGSYIQLALISAVVLFPCSWLLTLITRKKINAAADITVNLLCMIAIFFLFSVFRYEKPYIIAIAAVIHIAANAFIISKAEKYDPKKVRRMKENAKKGRIKQLALSLLQAALYTCAADVLYIFLCWKVTFIYYGYTY